MITWFLKEIELVLLELVVEYSDISESDILSDALFLFILDCF